MRGMEMAVDEAGDVKFSLSLSNPFPFVHGGSSISALVYCRPSFFRVPSPSSFQSLYL